MKNISILFRATVLAAALVATSAGAQVWSQPNADGGKIVLTSQKTERCLLGVSSFAYTNLRSGQVISGCWAIVHGQVHVTWSDGVISVYAMADFEKEPAPVAPPPVVAPPAAKPSAKPVRAPQPTAHSGLLSVDLSDFPSSQRTKPADAAGPHPFVGNPTHNLAPVPKGGNTLPDRIQYKLSKFWYGE